ncbi:hypothetical protein NDU88_000377 [Pleurodeles waltl]|uniref:Uncharacterized protein n=1 Tax=Pleurodeles waltl TaxID=8319 RepID=A0AAV7U3C2_PLEWA|nr:hypothetical protein NDU88_000377 [Pleurodeles waltl]
MKPTPMSLARDIRYRLESLKKKDLDEKIIARVPDPGQLRAILRITEMGTHEHRSDGPGLSATLEAAEALTTALATSFMAAQGNNNMEVGHATISTTANLRPQHLNGP